jgi:uncharacterized membrane protein
MAVKETVGRVVWAGSFLIVLAYAGFALSSAGTELLHQLGLADEARPRSAPIFFVVHALAGTVALVGGPLQWVRAWRGHSSLHRLIGRAYVAAVVVSAATALRMAVSFDVPYAPRVSFAVLAVLWLTTTLFALERILAGDVPSHRAWMTRSYALTLFFLTGPIGMAVAESGWWTYERAYPIAITAAWASNLAIAEVFIRWRRAGGRPEVGTAILDWFRIPTRRTPPWSSPPPSRPS